MAYSKAIEDFLVKNKTKVGDEVEVSASGKKYTGILMPRPDIGDVSCIVLKLENGYNIGVKFSKNMSAKKVSHQHSGLDQEKDIELGKIKESLVKVKFDESKPKVSLIATGGTIASRVDYKTGGVYMQMDPKEFLHNVPELADVVNIKNIFRPFTKATEDMDHKDFQEIAKLVAERLNSDDKGVIVTLGTDILHYVTAAVSFMIQKPNKPVVFTAAQKSSDRGSSDAFMNLLCAAYLSVSDIAEIGVCMHATTNDDFCFFSPATKVRKNNAVRRDAFQPVNGKPFVRIYPDGKIEKISGYSKRSENKASINTKWEPKVALLKAYPDSEPSVIEWYISNGYKGFVIEGTGLGHVPTHANKSWIPTIKKHKEIPFVVVSQTLSGRVNPNVYSNLRTLFHEAGAISGEDMTPETAWAKLSWILGQTNDMGKVRELMGKNLVGEISERDVLYI